MRAPELAAGLAGVGLDAGVGGALGRAHAGVRAGGGGGLGGDGGGRRGVQHRVLQVRDRGGPRPLAPGLLPREPGLLIRGSVAEQQQNIPHFWFAIFIRR